LTVDALVVARDPGSLVFDLPLDIPEVVESSVGDVVKFGPFIAGGFCWVPVADARGSLFSLIFRDVDQLKDEGPSGDDAAAAGQEVSSNDVLEDRRFASRLRTYNNLSGLRKPY